MDDPAPTAASSALSELLEVSPQVDAAVIIERDGGSILASAPLASERMADRFGATCTRILEAAERARTELGREPVSQIEVATQDGHVFVVADTTWIVAAVTDADPTVGLVFYDLKTALRSVRESRGADGAPVAPATSEFEVGSGGDVTTEALVTPMRGDDAGSNGPGDEPLGASDGDDDASEAEAQGASRWRRRKS